MLKKGWPLALAIISSCLLPGAIRAADGPGKIQEAVDRAFRPLMTQYDVPGIAVAVTIEGRQYFFNYGLASTAKKTPVTKDTLFEIGSVSKTFTATLVAYAQTLGKLSLDDHPGKYMPELRGHAIDQATLLNLGTFTAGGLPLQFPDAVGNAQMPAYFQEWKPSAAPGAERLYSNPSIGLLGYLASLAMKGNFADLIEQEILPKLGLGHTYIRVPQAQMYHYAWGYNKDNQPIRVNPGVFDAEAYGIKSTAADLVHYLEINIRPGNLQPPIRLAVEGTHIAYFKIGDMLQGLGWEQYAYPITLERLLAGNSAKVINEPNPATQISHPQASSGPALFDKTGSTGGFGAYVAFVPAKRIGIVMLANKHFPIPERVTAAHAVLEQLAAEAR